MKKKEDLMKEQREKFINGAIENGYDKEFAEEMFGLIEKFAGYGFNRCIAADVKLERSSGNGHTSPKITVEKLYKNWHSNTSVGKKYRNPNRGIKILSYDSDGRIRPRRVKKVYKTGIKPIYKIILEDDNTIKSTEDHRFLTKKGEWKRLKSLEKGGYLLVKGNYEHTQYDYSLTKQKQTQDDCVNMEGHQGFYSEEKNPGYIDGSYVEFKKAKEKVYKRSNGKCEKCGVKEDRMEYHHLDGDRTNNLVDNIQYLCVSCHKKAEFKLGRNRKWDKGYPVIPTKIEKIEYIGEEQTYDLEMDSNYEMGHNYLANNIVTHNSHSAAYSTLSYATAYLKNYFPVEFYASIMSFEADKTPKDSSLQAYMSDCYQKDIDILPPSINKSNRGFTAVNHKIRFGLESIKGVGGKALNDILKKRPFKSFIDFYDRVEKRLVNKTCVEALIKAGAFDEIENNRKKLIDNYYNLRENDFYKPRLYQFNKGMGKEDYIEMELETLNMSITYPSSWDMCKSGNKIRLVGKVSSISYTETKHGSEMAFVDFNTIKNVIKLIVFPDKLNKYKGLLKRDDELIIAGEKSKDNSLLVEGIRRKDNKCA